MLLANQILQVEGEPFDTEFAMIYIIKNYLSQYERVMILNSGFNFRSSSRIKRLLQSHQSIELVYQKETALSVLNIKDVESAYEESILSLAKKPFKASKRSGLNFGRAEEYGLIPIIRDTSNREIGYHKMYCSIETKMDVMYFINFGAYLKPQEAIFNHNPQQIKIALLTLTINSKGEDILHSRFFKFYLPALLKTLKQEELKTFTIVIYLGYDREDPLFDLQHQECRELLKSRLSGVSNINVKFHKLPRYKRLVLLWNILAASAYRDGCDYFFQLNDDSVLLNSGWLSQFVGTLQKNQDLGVIGPNDTLWNCRILTQVFVARKHYEIFGWLFPPKIRDWYSDNWITLLYGRPYTFCSAVHRVQNLVKNASSKLQGSKRYQECNNPKWKEELAKGKHLLSRFIQSSHLNSTDSKH